MLERRLPSQRHHPASEPSPKIDERKRKENGRRIEKQAKPSRRRLRRRVRACELRPRLFQRLPGLNREQAPQRVVDRRKKNFQETSVGSESLSDSLVRLGRWLHCKIKKT